MLKHLSIENYALIDSLSIDFYPGFSVITGETGAGKSILLGALGLILGNRADTQTLLNKEKKCIVEGVFNIKNYGLEYFFRSNELDYDNQTILRREINKSGKTRAFINDTPVNLNQMKELGDKLVNIHSQHKTITLNDTDFQLAVVDDYVQHNNLLQKYRSHYHDFQKLKQNFFQLQEQEKNSKAEQDYFRFLYDELEKAALLENEQEELESELEVLNNAEEIKSGLFKSIQLLGDEEKGILTRLIEVKGQLTSLQHYHKNLDELGERLNSNIIDLKDIAAEIEGTEEEIRYDPERLEEVNERLNLIYSLEQKHRVQSMEELIRLREEISTKLEGMSSLEEELKKLEQEIEKKQAALKQLAGHISNNRKNALPDIEKKVIGLLMKLGMPEAVFKIDFQETDRLGPDGRDSLRFLFNANKGGMPGEVSRIASGGELSRLMLSIKSLISHKNLLPTIIFDEIDMGVSGDIANKVGDILLKMAGSMQVIAISHLPQIAGKGGKHYLVYKDSGGEITTSRIKAISGEERLTEIAKMLSGEKITKGALENARELLVHNN
ncbi:MAG: DNA repair protein RecN [Bacteroidales bacterium]|nr:DNA repair protein RecN [Bacteroidales bacterium]MCF8344838.1 DNA repair protein RecN [Bacteroidales bacterium]MCF8377020.1 DNA repair protein RecN [Bacteroidales bacterium]MCF8400901.1 DNA repair protein RecN [Bacteroidales bacterium]